MTKKSIIFGVMVAEIQKTIQRNIAEFYIVTPSVYVDDSRVVLDFEITTKMMEIAEDCSTDCYDKVEEILDECIEERIDEINREYAFSRVTLETDKFVVRLMPILCDCDYCKVGGDLEIEIYATDPEYINNMLSDILKAVETVINLS